MFRNPLYYSSRAVAVVAQTAFLVTEPVRWPVIDPDMITFIALLSPLPRRRYSSGCAGEAGRKLRYSLTRLAA